MKVLAIGAHFDDIELGCGGTLLRWRDEGAKLTFFVATRSGYDDTDGKAVRTDETAREEGKQAAERLGARLIEGGLPTSSLSSGEELTQKLMAALEVAKPDVVLTHWNQDTHNDHRVLGQASLHCCRRAAGLLMYRSNWHTSAACFEPRIFVDIGKQLEDKVALVRLHASEFEHTSGRWEGALLATARELGERAGCQHAEGFQVVRWRLQ